MASFPLLWPLFDSKLIESSAGGETEATLSIDSTDVSDSDIIWAKTK